MCWGVRFAHCYVLQVWAIPNWPTDLRKIYVSVINPRHMKPFLGGADFSPVHPCESLESETCVAVFGNWQELAMDLLHPSFPMNGRIIMNQLFERNVLVSPSYSSSQCASWRVKPAEVLRAWRQSHLHSDSAPLRWQVRHQQMVHPSCWSCWYPLVISTSYWQWPFASLTHWICHFSYSYVSLPRVSNMSIYVSSSPLSGMINDIYAVWLGNLACACIVRLAQRVLQQLEV